MPGDNCSIFGCSTSRKEKGVSIWKIPAPKDEATAEWRKKLIGIVLRDRVLDENLQRQLDNDRLHICEKHFTDDQLYIYPHRRHWREGAIPTLHMPSKSVPSKQTGPRNTSSIDKRDQLQMVSSQEDDDIPRKCFIDFDDFQRRVKLLKLKGWSLNFDENYVEIYKNNSHLLPEMQIFTDFSLEIFIRVYGWMLPESHEIFSESKSFYLITPSRLIKFIDNYSICNGIDSADVSNSLNIARQIVPKRFNFVEWRKSDQNHVCEMEYLRSKDCILLLKDSSKVCHECSKLRIKTIIELRQKENKIKSPVSVKAPLSLTSHQRLVETIKQDRQIISKHVLKCAELEERIEEINVELQKSACNIGSELGNDLVDIFENVPDNRVPPFMKLFWGEQMKYLKTRSKTQVRYHPMIIKFCLAIAAKSPSAYRDLRYDEKSGSGVLMLPSERTLRDYRNVIKPQTGFNPATINDLGKKSKDFSDVERYVVILMDEMKVQEDLVWDRNSGELVGFVDLGNLEINYATLKKADSLASHVLVFLVKSIVNPLSYSLATFATSGITSFQMFPLFWRAVSILELSCQLHVIACTADGCSVNRKFAKLHKQMDGSNEGTVIFRVMNPYSGDIIWFFSDPPHLVKTARNCLKRSTSDRPMWKNGMHLLWSHISDLVHEDMEFGLKLLPKLSSNHINLTSYSVMNVRLAAQVLSNTVGNILKEFGRPEASETSKFCLDFDKFFDCCNVRNTKEHIHKRKPFLKPYTHVSDDRFLWLECFLEELEKWKSSIEARPGDFDSKRKQFMFLSAPTYEGIIMTANSLIGSVVFLLDKGVKYVLTERFCQDDLENYFGRQRAIGRSSDNPRVYDVGYNDNLIKTQYSVKPIQGGNVQGASKWNDISDEPLEKRKKSI